MLLALEASAHAAEPLPSSWDKGFNYTEWWHDSYAATGAETTLDRLVTTGANSVSINPTWYMSSATANAVAPDAMQSPTDASITTAIRRAQFRGLRVYLRPMVDVRTGAWRGSIAPTDVDAWFASYRSMLSRYANLAQSLGVQMLSVGAEFSSLERYDAQWRQVIADVRARFSGKLTYGANWNAYAGVTFWDALDLISVDAYFPLGTGTTPSEDAIHAAWSDFTDRSGQRHRYVDELAAVAARAGKPLFFSEVGFTPTATNLVEPWAVTSAPYDGGAQARALSATLRAFRDRPWFRGVYVWHWPAKSPAGGVSDVDHSVQGKPAEDALRQWFQRVAPAPAPPAPAPGPTPAPVASASSEASSALIAGNALDGNAATRWASAPGRALPQWWQVDLGTVRSVDAVTVDWASGAFASRYTIQTSLDGTSWGTAASVKLSAARSQRTSFPPRRARFVRVLATRSDSGPVSVSEVRVTGSATAARVTRRATRPATTARNTKRGVRRVLRRQAVGRTR